MSLTNLYKICMWSTYCLYNGAVVVTASSTSIVSTFSKFSNALSNALSFSSRMLIFCFNSFWKLKMKNKQKIFKKKITIFYRRYQYLECTKQTSSRSSFEMISLILDRPSNNSCLVRFNVSISAWCWLTRSCIRRRNLSSTALIREALMCSSVIVLVPSCEFDYLSNENHYL